ncbi:MAG: hypothetical protein HGA95_01230 [Caldiserica bacterium]|nr:hypothetical protein [Caldisericota bacterium]
MTDKVYFTHLVGQTHTQRWGFYENDRHILFFDAAQISCFDTQSKKLLWEKVFVTGTQDLGNGYFWGPVVDESTVRVFGLSDPKKYINIKIDKGHLKPFIYPSESCVLSLDVAGQGYRRVLKRYGWDGDVTVLDELPGGNDNLRLPFVFKGMVYAWVESEMRGRGTLFKYINNGWSKVYQSNVYGWHTNYCQYDRFLAFYCDRNRIKVLNLGTNIAKLIETKEKTGIWFAGGLLVIVKQFDCMVYNPSTCKVLDEYAGQIACSEKDTLYMVRGPTLKIFSNGKITQTKLDPIAANMQGRFSVSNGLLLADCLLFDREGRFCQELPTSMFGAKLVTVNGISCLRQDNGSQILIHEVAQSARYSISREPGKIIVKNIGKVKLEGKCWIEPSSNFICAKLEKPIILDIAPGQSAQINLGNSQSMVILKTNGFLDSNYYGQTKQTFKLPDWLGSITSPDGEILSLIETN